MPTLYILCGIPGSGKTTFCKDFCKENKDIWYISRDKIRFSLLKDDEDYFSHEDEVMEMFVRRIGRALKNNIDVIADATHINKYSRKKLIRAVDKYTTKYSIVYLVFNTDIADCIIHNNKREGRQRVPENVIYTMYNNFQMPVKEEDVRIEEIIII